MDLLSAFGDELHDVLRQAALAGPLARDPQTGVVVAPEPAELARACAYLAAHADEARAWGRAGKAVAERVTWDGCIDALLT